MSGKLPAATESTLHGRPAAQLRRTSHYGVFTAIAEPHKLPPGGKELNRTTPSEPRAVLAQIY